MGDRNDHSDMIPYVIAFLIALVVINVVMSKWTDGYVDAIEKVTGLQFK